MSTVKDYVLILGVIVIIALLIFRPGNQERQIPAEVVLKLDSLNKLNLEHEVTKAVLKERNRNLEQEIWDLNNQLADIKPKYIPIFKEYKDAPPERKKELVKSEYEKRLKEREGDK